MKLFRSVAVLVCASLAVSLAGCGGGEAGKADRSAALTVDQSLVDANNYFGANLYRKLAATDTGKNVFVSPPSIELALAMTLNGAKTTTSAGMSSAMGLGSLSLDQVNRANGQLITLLTNPDPKVDLLVANALWVQKGLTPDSGFLQRNQEFYRATVDNVDFADSATADRINQWASDHTMGTIPKIVAASDIEKDVIELTNAVYFKGPWTDPFDPKDTQDGAFTKTDGTTKTLPMMRRQGLIDYQVTDLFQAVRLPYGGKYLSMSILLSTPGKTLSDIAVQITAQNWKKWQQGFVPQEVFLQMPRFKADYGASLKEALSALGMADAFDPTRADFSGIFAPGTALIGGVYLTHVFHKTYLSVDEKGTTAAAVTDVGAGAGSGPASMIVNRPFFVVISDAPTGVILFMGSIADPQ